jgi:hypothetical protein
VRIATLERFADASRRCDPTLVGEPHDAVVLWDLEAGDVPSPFDVFRALGRWPALPISAGARLRLLRECFRMSSGRRAAMVRAPDWIRALQAKEIDELVCFSADGFAFARRLAVENRIPLRQFLATGTQYFGEFAFELLAVVPYAYWLHQHGLLELTVSTADTRCLYYFSPKHIEHPVPRRYVPITEYPVGVAGERGADQPAFPAVLDTTKWSPPPYPSVYRDDRFRWAKPPVVVCNKTSDEHYLGAERIANSLDVELLLTIVDALRARYTVVYNRPRSSDIVGDHAEICETGDIESLEHAFPDVVTIQHLHAIHSDLTFNELQLRLFASCERFVSVVGGSSYLASYFGGTNVVYAKQGWEVDCGAFDSWFHQFSGARVVAAGTPTELRLAVRQELLS